MEWNEMEWNGMKWNEMEWTTYNVRTRSAIIDCTRSCAMLATRAKRSLRTTAQGPCRSRVFVVAAAVAARRRRRRCRRRRHHRRRRRRRVRRRRRRAPVRRRSAPKLTGVITMFLTLMDFDDAASESWSCSSVHAQVVGYSYISRDIT